MEDLKESTVIRAGQRPAMFCYVPLDVFLCEAPIALGLYVGIGIYVFSLLPVHIWMVWKTADNPFWVRALLADMKYWWFKANKGLRGKGVLTFTASPPNPSKNDYADIK